MDSKVAVWKLSMIATAKYCKKILCCDILSPKNLEIKGFVSTDHLVISHD